MNNISITINDETDKQIREILRYSLNHNCKVMNKSGIIRACIAQTYDLITNRTTKSLLSYFDNEQEYEDYTCVNTYPIKSNK